jgi:ribosome-binding protein aMBF1 (putative translation factor)
LVAVKRQHQERENEMRARSISETCIKMTKRVLGLGLGHLVRKLRMNEETSVKISRGKATKSQSVKKRIGRLCDFETTSDCKPGPKSILKYPEKWVAID